MIKQIFELLPMKYIDVYVKVKKLLIVEDQLQELLEWLCPGKS